MLSSYTRAPFPVFFALFSAAATLFCEATSDTRLPLTSKTTRLHNEINPDLGIHAKATNGTSPDCNIESRTWCSHDQSCYVTTDGFKCANWTTTGWVIVPDLHFFYTPENQTSPISGTCSLLPLPTNTTLQDLLILAIKRYDAHYRTSTILISDKPISILAGYSNCRNVHQRCMDDKCVPVIPLGEVCEGNSECFNAHMNETNTMGPICEYVTGKLEEPPRCVNYVQVPAHPDNDTSPDHRGHKRSYVWIYIVAVLLFALLMVALFLIWWSRHPSYIVPTILDQSFEEPVAPLAEGPIGGSRRVSTAAGLMHEKDMELDQEFWSRIGHRSSTVPVHRTERLWGDHALVVQPPIVGPHLQSALEDRVNNGVYIEDIPLPAPFPASAPPAAPPIVGPDLKGSPEDRVNNGVDIEEIHLPAPVPASAPPAAPIVGLDLKSSPEDRVNNGIDIAEIHLPAPVPASAPPAAPIMGLDLKSSPEDRVNSGVNIKEIHLPAPVPASAPPAATVEPQHEYQTVTFAPTDPSTDTSK